jgi:CBS domain-containing protein
MTSDVVACRPSDTLDRVAQVMWDCDCGAVPIVDDGGCIVGMVTDRDACMAAYTRGRLLSEILVDSVMSRDVVSARLDEAVADVEARMKERQIRRVPVVDDDDRLRGMLSLNDLALQSTKRRSGVSQEEVVETLAAICRHRQGPAVHPAE